MVRTGDQCEDGRPPLYEQNQKKLRCSALGLSRKHSNQYHQRPRLIQHKRVHVKHPSAVQYIISTPRSPLTLNFISDRYTTATTHRHTKIVQCTSRPPNVTKQGHFKTHSSSSSLRPFPKWMYSFLQAEDSRGGCDIKRRHATVSKLRPSNLWAPSSHVCFLTTYMKIKKGRKTKNYTSHLFCLCLHKTSQWLIQAVFPLKAAFVLNGTNLSHFYQAERLLLGSSFYCIPNELVRWASAESFSI